MSQGRVWGRSFRGWWDDWCLYDDYTVYEALNRTGRLYQFTTAHPDSLPDDGTTRTRTCGYCEKELRDG